jgi:hypothetical protein
MKGRKISAEEFIKNYRNVRQDEINKPVQPQVDMIYKPVVIEYAKLVKETEKAYLFIFEDGVEYWFPKRLCKVSKRPKQIVIPMFFTNETALLDFAVKDSEVCTQLTYFLGRENR